MAEVAPLIRELLATGQMNEDTAAELNRMLAEEGGGRLLADDAAYVRALHARITNAPLPEPEPAIPAEPERLDGLTLGEWRERALRAEAELAGLRGATTQPQNG
jgi:hypothetical protein